MQPETRAWLDGLREAIAAAGAVGGGEATDDAAAAAERAILSAHLATWFAGIDALLAARRDLAGAAGGGVDPEPAIVLTTSPVGIAAAEAWLAGDTPRVRELRPRLACTTEPVYRGWCMRHPDDTHRLHVNHWNWIKTRVPPQRNPEFARHPLRPGDAYWIHRVGTAGAGAADGRESHLWRFDGRHATLLEAFVVEFDRPPSGP